MKTVATKNAPAALGPYAQAQVSGGFVFTSGQIGIDPATGVIADGVLPRKTFSMGEAHDKRFYMEARKIK